MEITGNLNSLIIKKVLYLGGFSQLVQQYFYFMLDKICQKVVVCYSLQDINNAEHVRARRHSNLYLRALLGTIG